MHCDACVCVCVCVRIQGLPVGTQRRMEQWRFAAPCRVRLAYPTGLANVNLAATGIYNALRQLECLPMQSTVSVPTTFVDTSITLKVVLAAVRAIGDRRPNLTVRLPSVVGSDTLLAQLCTEDMRGKHVAIRRLQLTGGYTSLQLHTRIQLHTRLHTHAHPCMCTQTCIRHRILMRRMRTCTQTNAARLPMQLDC